MASSKSSKQKAAETDPAAKVKIGVAIVCFVVAALALAWNFELFSFGPDPVKVAAQEEAALPPEVKEKRNKELQRTKEIQQEMEKKPGTVKAGA